MTNKQKKEFKLMLRSRRMIKTAINEEYNNDYAQIRDKYCRIDDQRLKDILNGNLAMSIMNKLLIPYNKNYEYFIEEFVELEKRISEIMDFMCNTNIN